MTNKITVVIFCLLSIFSVNAQDRLWFEEINIEDGLSQSTILCMYQDRKGFIWIGTQYGLNRFDGYHFETYLNEIDNDKSISSNYILSIFEDSKGVLWVATDNGLNALNKTSNQFKRYLHNPKDKNSLSNNLISSIAEDQLGNIWIGTSGGGLNKFNKKLESFEALALKSNSENELNPSFITNIMTDIDGMLWVTSGKARLRPSSQKGGIFLVDPILETISQISPKQNQKKLDIRSVTSIFQDEMQNIWFGTINNGLLKKPKDSRKFKQILLNKSRKDNPITAIEQDKLGRMWIATQHTGLYMFDELDDKVIHYDSTSLESSNLSDDDLVSLLFDSTGVFWVGSWTNGINKLDFEAFQFQKYLQSPGKHHAAKPDVLDINKDSMGNVWLATWENGLQKINMSSGETIRPEVLTPEIVGTVRHVFVDRNDKIWMGSNENGIIYFDPENNNIKSYKHNSNDIHSLSNNTVIQIIDDPIGNLWVATRGGGLNYFNVTEEKFYHYKNNSNDNKTLMTDRINALVYDDQGLLWVGTNQGLDIFDPVEEQVIAHYQGNGEKSGILGKNITTIFNDKYGRTWIGTEKGITKVNFPLNNNRKELTFSWDIGFGNSQLGSVGAILDDKDGNLWISSFKYITRYNPETQEFRNFDSSSGVLRGGYYIGSSHQDNDGNLYFGGLNGLTVFQAETREYKSKEPKIVLTQLLLFNKPIFADNGEKSILKDSIDNTNKLEFNYKENVFSIEFSALHYSSPEDNQYAYKLEGFDEQWINTDSNNRRATYTNLDPGTYQFYIKASNNEGIWNNPVKKLDITVIAAPWKTNLAYSIYFLLVGLIIGSFVWLRIKQMQAIKLRNEQLSLSAKLFENTSECVWLVDNNLNYLAVNKGFCDVTGYSESETIGKKIQLAEVKNQNESLLTDIFESVNNGGRWEGEMWSRRKSNDIYPIDIVIDRVTLKNAHGDISGYQYVGVFSDITKRKKAEEELRFMAYFDKLTFLPNRSYFNLLVTESIQKNQQNDSFAIFYLDLDNFKNVNDSLGHSYGDELLVTIAERLKDFSDERYTISRLGGDEFALMVPHQYLDDSIHPYVAKLAEEILIIVRQKVVVNKHVLHVSASIGATIFPNDGKDYEELLRNTDTAMYKAKKRGGNAFALYHEDMNVLARKRLMLEDELNKALLAQEIVPHYQPKVSLESGQMEGLEILARWNHNRLGWIPPDQFIPVAEESKLINEISDQLLIKACQFLLPYIKSGKINGRIAFNLSITQFVNDDIVTRIDEILATCQFPSEYLEIEITESMVMGNVDKAIKLMKKFTKRNIAISIDDFGTGYSSLSYLKKLPIDTLKIDISFIKDIVKSVDDQKIVKSIIHLAHNLGLKVVAEGGETLEQTLLLKEMDCELLQGYYYSKALSEEQFKAFLKKSENLFSEKLE
jgi:diguanylate cyclase (GGDEF)-like protein/PAS domain S-box-containing protein